MGNVPSSVLAGEGLHPAAASQELWKVMTALYPVLRAWEVML